MRKALFLLSVISLLLVMAVGVQIYASRKAEESLKKILSGLGVRSFSYEDVSYSLLTGRTEVEDLVIEGKEGRSRIRKLVISKATDRDLEIHLLGVRGENEDFRKMEKGLRELGYEKAELNLHFSASLFEEGTLLVRELSLRLPGAFTLSLSLKLSGVDRRLVEDFFYEETEPSELAKRLGKVYLREVAVRVKDEGLLERIVRKEAEKKGVTPEEVREEMIKEIEKSLGKGPLTEGLAELVRKGGVLILEGKPSGNLPLDEFILYTFIGFEGGDFSLLFKELNLRAKHEPIANLSEH